MRNGKLYKYGMKLRPYSIGCQPKGVYDVFDGTGTIYWNIMFYDRKLSMKEINDYDLVYIGEVEKSL